MYPNTINNNKTEYSYAGFWIRFFATVLDMIMFMLIAVLFGVIIALIAKFTGKMVNINPHNPENNYWVQLASLLYWIYYFPLSVASDRQGTLGKHFMGIKIVNRNGTKLSFIKAVAREFAKGISALLLGIGFLMVIFSKRKLALHDIICNTYVVRK